MCYIFECMCEYICFKSLISIDNNLFQFKGNLHFVTELQENNKKIGL